MRAPAPLVQDVRPKIEDGLEQQHEPEPTDHDHEPNDRADLDPDADADTDAAQTRAASRPRSRSAKASKPLSPSESTHRGRGAKKQPKVEEHDYEHVPEKRRGGQRAAAAAARKQPEREPQLPQPEPEPDQGDQEDEDDDDDDDEGGDGGVTRCVCQEDTDEMSSGLMIQCDMCKCWQHGPCVGLWNDKDCPDRYFCEMCRPGWHGPGGLLRKTHRKAAPATSNSTAAASAAHHRSPSAATAAAAATSSSSTRGARESTKPRESADAALVAAFLSAEQSVGPPDDEPEQGERSPSVPVATIMTIGKDGKEVEVKAPKKRSTMNSRDAAYDDAIAMSILGPGSAAMRARLEKARGDGDRSGSNGGDKEDDSADEASSDHPRRSTSRESDKYNSRKHSPAGSASTHSSKRRRVSPEGAAVVTAHDETVEHDEPEPELAPAEPESVPMDTEQDQEVQQAVEPEPEAVEMDVEPEGPAVEPEAKVASRAPSPVAQAKDPEPVSIDNAEQGRELDKESLTSTSAPPARAKHPNQYTYRPKGAPLPPKPTRASPTKRVASGAANGHSNSHGSVPASASTLRASAHTAPNQWSLPVEQSGWGLPDHLRHLSHLLPSPLPAPLAISVPLKPASDASSSSSSTTEHLEPATRVKFPNKRMTLSEMKKRARTVLEYLTRIQIEMSERDRRTEALLAAVAGAGASSTTPSSSGSATPRTVHRGRKDKDATPPMESMMLMDLLTKDLILFQQRFD